MPQSITDIKLTLCLLDKECPGSIHNVKSPPGPTHGASFCVGLDGHVYPTCKGTGRVWLLDSDGKFELRVRCRCDDAAERLYWLSRGGCKVCYMAGEHVPDCVCQGRCWTPNRNLENWLEAVGKVVRQFSLSTPSLTYSQWSTWLRSYNGNTHWGWGNSAEASFLAALEGWAKEALLGERR